MELLEEQEGSKSGIIGQTEIDYEEGTFNVTFAANSQSDVTKFSYTKIGSAVTVSGFLAFTDLGAGGPHAVTISSGTLPFVNRDQANGGTFQAPAAITRLIDDFEDGIYMLAYYSSATLHLVRGSKDATAYEPSGMAVVNKGNVSQTDIHLSFCATYLVDA